MNKKQKKIVRYALLALGGILLALIVILVPCMTEVVWFSDDNLIEQNSAVVSIMVLIPFLVSVISFLISEKFIASTLQEQKNKVEEIYNKGYLSIEKYIEIIKFLDEYDEQKVNAKIEIETKKAIAKIEQEKNVKERITRAKEQIKEQIDEQDFDDEIEIEKDGKKEKSVNYYS